MVPLNGPALLARSKAQRRYDGSPRVDVLLQMRGKLGGRAAQGHQAILEFVSDVGRRHGPGDGLL